VAGKNSNNGDPIKDDSGQSIFLVSALSVVLSLWAGFVLFSTKSQGSSLAVKIFFPIVVISIPVLCITGLCFLIWHQWRFGRAFLFLDADPLRLGDTITGIIKVTILPQNLDFIEVRIRCNQHSQFKSVPDRTLWTGSACVRPGEIEKTDTGQINIPVKIAVPVSGKPTGGRIYWTLEAAASPEIYPRFVFSFHIAIAPGEKAEKAIPPKKTIYGSHPREN
jgi:hypothetical protein